VLLLMVPITLVQTALLLMAPIALVQTV